MSKPKTTQTPIELAVLPDWSVGVAVSFAYKNGVVTSLSGWQQIIRHWSRPRFKIEIQRSTTGAEDNRSLTFDRQDQATTPVMFPLWSHGTPVSNNQGTSETLILDIAAPKQIKVGSRIFIYDPETGGQWRTVEGLSNSNRTLTLNVEGGETLIPQLAWVFPTEIGTFSISQGGRQSVQTTASRESLSFMSL